MKDSLIQVQTTVLTQEEAKSIAQIMIEEKLSAYVQYYPIVSHYKWKGQMEEAQEFLLIIKSTLGKYEQIKSKIEEIHSYELPQIILIKNYNYSEGYANWIIEETK